MVNFAAYCNIVCVCVLKMVNIAAYCNIVCVCVENSALIENG